MFIIEGQDIAKAQADHQKRLDDLAALPQPGRRPRGPVVPTTALGALQRRFSKNSTASGMAWLMSPDA